MSFDALTLSGVFSALMTCVLLFTMRR